MWKKFEEIKRKAAEALIELLEGLPEIEMGIRVTPEGAVEFYVRVYELYCILKRYERRS